MGVIRYDIIEGTLDERRLPQYELSILTGMDSSSYLIAEPDGKVAAIRAFSHPPEEAWWTTDDRLRQSFRTTTLGWLDPRFTLVPARLYKAEDRRAVLANLTKLDAGETVMADALPQLDAYLVYALRQDRLDAWRRAYVGGRFYHGFTPILHALAERSRRTGKATVYAYLRDGLLFTVAMERERLLFCNAFSCPAAKDYLYYILLTYEQCGRRPEQVPLRLFGEILPTAEVYKLLYRYVRDLDFLQEDTETRRGSGFHAHDHPTHLFYDLFRLRDYQ